MCICSFWQGIHRMMSCIQLGKLFRQWTHWQNCKLQSLLCISPPAQQDFGCIFLCPALLQLQYFRSRFYFKQPCSLHNGPIEDKLELFGQKLILVFLFSSLPAPVVNRKSMPIIWVLVWNKERGTVPTLIHSVANGASTEFEKRQAELMSKSCSWKAKGKPKCQD